MTLPALRHSGAPGRLTPTQRIELWAWVKARRHLGWHARRHGLTWKAKAAELGLTVPGLEAAVRNLRRRAGEMD